MPVRQFQRDRTAQSQNDEGQPRHSAHDHSPAPASAGRNPEGTIDAWIGSAAGWATTTGERKRTSSTSILVGDCSTERMSSIRAGQEAFKLMRKATLCHRPAVEVGGSVSTAVRVAP